MKRKIYIAATLLLFIHFGSLSAQTVEKKALTLEGAMKIIAAAVKEAKKSNAPGAVIAVVDEGGNLMALERLDNTFAAGANISIGKARTAALFKRPTKVFEEIIKNGRTSMVALSDFTPLQGGVPILLDGQLIGGVGVSGAASAQQDEELAIAGAAGLTASQPGGGAGDNGGAMSMPITYFDQNEVHRAFAKGMPLTENGKYKVHASRRDTAGMAEVHVRDTDIIYVLDGSATFITGGTVVEPETTATDEIRGKEITGGETRRLAKGDVIIVPNGTPHWFQRVNGPLTYYVVKVP